MSQQEFSPRRSRAARKPWPECPDITIYRCQKCSQTLLGLGKESLLRVPDHCDTPMVHLEAIQADKLPAGLHIDYKIVGGFNSSAVQVFWESSAQKIQPEWILLKTFTGSYLKYRSENKFPPMVFPLADEDAYVYCDRDICEECLFRCKRGFIIYLYFKSIGLVEIPLERMQDYFKK